MIHQRTLLVMKQPKAIRNKEHAHYQITCHDMLLCQIEKI